MELRKMGSLNVSVVGLGCNNFGWRIGAEESKTVIEAALNAGINFFDTADMYSTGLSEEYMSAPLSSRRKQVVIATKFGFEMGPGLAGASPKYVRQAAEASLRRLRTDYIDLYQLHTPDPKTPIGDTLGAMQQLVNEGKVREIGCSNFSAEQLDQAKKATPAGSRGFVTLQNEYSLIHRAPEAAVLPKCKELGISFIPYFPLGNGLLSGKYRKGQPLPESSRAADEWGPKVFSEENIDLVERLVSFVESKGHTLLELAISWLASQPTVASVIAGAKTAEQAASNAQAANWKLTREELAEVDKIVGPSKS